TTVLGLVDPDMLEYYLKICDLIKIELEGLASFKYLHFERKRNDMAFVSRAVYIRGTLGLCLCDSLQADVVSLSADFRPCGSSHRFRRTLSRPASNKGQQSSSWTSALDCPLTFLSIEGLPVTSDSCTGLSTASG
ncbi:unnamed protein product, partial [Clavelina lepadiformis]